MTTLEEAINEKWRKIDGFPNYSISNLGRVRNDVTGHIKTLQYDKNGYLVCDLYVNKMRKQKKIHRLIADAFIPNPDNKPYINHINGIRDDNRIENLEWCTPSENNYHAWNILDSDERRSKMAKHAHNRIWTEESREKISKNKKGKKLSKQGRKNISEAHKKPRPYMCKPIKCIETNVIYFGLKEASMAVGCSTSAIRNALAGKNKTGGGYHWERLQILNLQ